MIIIVESGATKSDWCAIKNDGSTVRLSMAGMNLATMSDEAVNSIIASAMSRLDTEGEEADKVYFYAAGLIDKRGDRRFEFATDLLGAARAVCGRNPGVAAILGTGSNSCLFDGERIVRSVRPGGFILGDEGGAGCLGKLFVADFIKGLVPADVSEQFSADFQADYATLVNRIYRQEAPSAYLGSFAPWILERYNSSEYVRNLVDNNFRSFFERSLSQYDLKSHPVGVVGGFACACSDILRRIASEYGVVISGIIRQPMDGLIRYHKENFQ